MKKNSWLGRFLRSHRVKYSLLGLAAAALGILVLIPAFGILGVLWTVMSMGFAAFSVRLPRSMDEPLEPTGVPAEPEDTPESEEERP